MRKYEWWEKFLAGRILRDLAECDTHHDDLEKEHKELEKKHGEIYDRLQDCYEDKLDCNELTAKLLEDVNYYRTRTSQLLSALNDAVVIPDIKEIVDLDEAKIVKPYEMAIYDGFDLRAADPEYYALSLDTWKDVLTPIQAEVKDTLGRWVENIADCVIPSELGWGLGLFLADGSCGFREGMNYSGAWWRIVNGNIEYLKRAKRAFENYFSEVTFKIKEFPSYAKGSKTNFGKRKKTLYCLDVNVKKRLRDKQGKYISSGRGRFIEKFRNDFYLFGEKKVPACLWDKGNRKPKLEFLRGFIAGDGRHHDKGWQQVYVHSEMAVIGLIECMLNVGWKFKISKDKGCYVIQINRQREHIPFLADYIYEKGEVLYKDVERWLKEHYLGRHVGHAIRILEEEGYVRRLLKRTSYGRPQKIKALKPYPEACDDWALVMQSFLTIAFRDARFDKQGALNIVWSYTHAYNSFVDTDKKVWIYEPQNNEIVGEFKQTEKPYNSRMVWFPHESLS